MKYKLVVFDMDGTILDTLEDICDSINYALQKNGYPQRTIGEVRSFVGNGINKLVERSAPQGTSSHDIGCILADFALYYNLHCYDKTRPYEGIVALIRELRSAGCLTAVVSNKTDDAVTILCRRFFDGLFDYSVGSIDGVQKKPAPDSVFAVFSALNESDAVYIGDSEVDIMTASNAKIPCITVLWGFRDRDFLESVGATTIAETPDDVYKLILG